MTFCLVAPKLRSEMTAICLQADRIRKCKAMLKWMLLESALEHVTRFAIEPRVESHIVTETDLEIVRGDCREFAFSRERVIIP